LLLTGISELAAPVLVRIFVSYNAKLYALSLHAFRIFSISYIFMGFNIFGSGFFTALNNGKISAILSFARSLLLQLISIYVLPAVFGPDGLWCAVVVSNVLCLILTIYMWVKYRKVYHY
jgi:Na+-driven multidrug efflux pump